MSGLLAHLVVHETHDAKRGLTVLRRPLEPGPSHDALKCPACVPPVTGHKARACRGVLREGVCFPQDRAVLEL